MISEIEYWLGRTCPTKVLHCRAGLPRNDRDNSYADWMIAETGKVRALASALFPSAIDAFGSCEQTQRHLLKDALVVNARFEGRDVSCKVDYLERVAGEIRLYSVVAKPMQRQLRQEQHLEFYGQDGNLRRDWLEHFELLALRASIVQQQYPAYRVVSLAVVPVKNAAASVEGLHGCFELVGKNWRLREPAAVPEASKLLSIVDVTHEVGAVIETVESKVAALNRFIENPGHAEIGCECQKCEFRVSGKRSGFDVCCGQHPGPRPVISGDAQTEGNRLAKPAAVVLPAECRYARRLSLQLEGATHGHEIIRPDLATELQRAVFPLHFLTIGGLRSLLPVHLGSTVGEPTLFQFNACRLKNATGYPEHVAWLNMEASDPSPRFLTQLRAILGENGTIVIWTRCTEESFCECLESSLTSKISGADLDWLMRFRSSGRILNMHELCFRHFWHPLMQNRTSLKAVLAAVWSVDSPLKNSTPFAEYSRDPFALQKSRASVSDDWAAMQAYLAMHAEGRVDLACDLIRYCDTNTLAMLFVWKYWQWRLQTNSNAETIALGAVQEDL